MFIVLQFPTVFAGVDVHSELAQHLLAAFGMHAPPEQALNAGAAQEQTPAPVQVRFPPHDTGDGDRQLPLEQVPVATRLTPEQVGVPQLVVLLGNVHLPPVHVPLQAALLPVQSLLLQHEELGTHVPVVGHTLFGDTQEHAPAPVQVKLVPQGALAGNLQVPPEQVPAPMRLPLVAQLATPQATVGYEQVPFV